MSDSSGGDKLQSSCAGTRNLHLLESKSCFLEAEVILLRHLQFSNLKLRVLSPGSLPSGSLYDVKMGSRFWLHSEGKGLTGVSRAA